MKKLLLAAALAATTASAAPGGQVAGSKHDFTAGGSTEFRSSDDASRCAYCHGSHGTGPRLSNRPDQEAPIRPFESTRMWSGPARPGNGSRMCLSCHDGTVAVGSTRSREHRVAGGERIGPDRRAYLGTDLRGSHPISVRGSGGRLARKPSGGDAVRVDEDDTVQCTSCHDPHREFGDPLRGKFLVKPSQRSALCLSCHDASAYEAVASSHASASPNDPTTSPSDPAMSISDAGCMACHVAHGAEPDSHLVRRALPGDDDSACLRCHGTGVASAPIGADLAKPFTHAVGARVHDAEEGPLSRRHRLPESSPGAPRHATCVDCHNPHAASDRVAQPPFAAGPLAGVWGIDLGGSRVEPVRYEYEVCFKCHGDSANKPQSAGPTPPETVRRAIIDVNLRNVFGPGAASSHPIAAPGRNPDVPGLKAPYGAGATIACSDCHGSDARGVRGPHGSSLPHILAREYSTAFPTLESEKAYGLCYECHRRETLLDLDLLGPKSGFPEHARHVVKASIPCASCHNAHGISSAAGDRSRNAHLIDFDVDVAKPNSLGRREFRDLGPRTGSCNLSCHGHAHDGTTYTAPAN